MKAIIRRAHKEVYEQELEAFVFGHPAQVALLGLQFQWTADMQARARGGEWGRKAGARVGRLGSQLGALTLALPFAIPSTSRCIADRQSHPSTLHPSTLALPPPGRAARRQGR